MKLLLKFGADIEHRDADGYTPLLVAIEFAQFKAMELLLAAGADPHAVLNDGCNALRLAVRRQSVMTFSSLVSSGANAHLPDNFGTVPLHEACAQGLKAVVENILDLCTESLSSVNHDSLIFGTPLYAAVIGGFTDIADLLLQHGATVDKIGPGNLLGSAIMSACARGDANMVRTLLSKGASLNVEGARFLSAAGTAQAFRQTGILKVLDDHTREILMSEEEQDLDGSPARKSISSDRDHDAITASTGGHD